MVLFLHTFDIMEVLARKGDCSMSKLFFFDIDGTLIDCNQDIYEITPETIRTLDKLKEEGHDVFLSTGRCKCFIVDGVMKYPFSGYVTCNGAYVEYKGKCVYKNVVPAKAIKATMDLCEKYHFNYYFEGNDYIYETMDGLTFKVGAKSFYQTNTKQAYHLYSVVRDFANLTGNELVYDLYTGTGTIANFVSRYAKRVIGIEYVPEAIEDAKINSEINNISNTLFFAGDMKDILTESFISENGTPDIIITDPPRAGMHPDVVQTIIKTAPKRIVYVSCNPATQERDLSLLDNLYEVVAVQPVDMFPHTPHVENVVLLNRRVN